MVEYIKYCKLKLALFIFFIITSAGCIGEEGYEGEPFEENVSVGEVPEAEEPGIGGPMETVTPDQEDYLKYYLEKYEKEGQIIFNPSEKMKTGETEVVEVYVTRNVSENIVKIIEENETLQSKNITVTPKMKLTLQGKEEGAFIIIPLTNDIQPISGERITNWKWKVTPQKSGRQTLILLVEYVISSTSYGTSNADYYTSTALEEEIEVEVSPYYIIQNSLTHLTLIDAVLAAIVGILGSLVFIWKRLMKKE